MIKTIFLKVINMSITASVVICAVIFIRWLFRKQPKIYSYILWSMVLFRLLCPVSISLNTSVFNILSPATVNNGQLEYSIPSEGIYPFTEPENSSDEKTNIDVIYNTEEMPIVSADTQIIISESNAPTENLIVHTEKPKTDFLHIASIIWLIGVIYILLNNLISIIDIKDILKNSKYVRRNIYSNKIIPTAFIMGIVNPKIYIPENLTDEQQEYVLMHEEIHIKRKDYLFKLLGFVAVCIHWFNPLVWLSYRLAENDMEMSCDEAVVKDLGVKGKAGYSQTLLSISVPKNNQYAMHLAFGEGETKERIVNIFKYKKPTFIGIVAFIVILAVSVISLAFNPTDVNAATVAGVKKDNISYCLLRNNNVYAEIPKENIYSIFKSLKKISITDDAENYVNNENGTNYLILTKDSNNISLNFNEDFTQLWVLDNASNYNGIVYNINNPDTTKQIFDKLLNSFKPIQEITQIIYPIFLNNTYYLNDKNHAVEPVLLNIQLPENWSVKSSKKRNFIELGEFNNTVAIYDHSLTHVGNISYENSLNYSDLSIRIENPQTKINGATTVSHRYIYDGMQYCICAENENLDARIFLVLDLDLISEEQLDNIINSVEIVKPNKTLSPKADYTIDFEVEADASEDTIAQIAIEKVVAFNNINCTTGKYYIHRNNEDKNIISVTFNYQFSQDGLINVIRALTMDIKQIDEYNFEITGYGAFPNKKYPINESYVERVERIQEIPYATKFEKNYEMSLGTSQILTEGKNGLSKQIVDIEYVNGIIVNETVIENNILFDETEEIIVHGQIWNGESINGGTGNLIWPVAAGRVSRGFTGDYPAHNGVDISAPIGTPIYAADSGMVTKALYTNVGYGIYCIIEHGGYQTLYGQCNELFVSAGEYVQQGQLIASVGSTGNSTGPHLHFEVKRGDTRYNPYDWF